MEHKWINKQYRDGNQEVCENCGTKRLLWDYIRDGLYAPPEQGDEGDWKNDDYKELLDLNDHVCESGMTNEELYEYRGRFLELKDKINKAERMEDIQSGKFMEEPVKVERYGKMVWETPAMDAQRKYHCMCLNCGKMKPGKDDHCKIASAFYEICKEHGNAFILTRCDSWSKNGKEEAI